jgi:hypothetical protein
MMAHSRAHVNGMTSMAMGHPRVDHSIMRTRREEKFDLIDDTPNTAMAFMIRCRITFEAEER